MNIDLTRIRNRIVSSIDLSFEAKFDEELLSTTDIIRLENVMVNGYIKRNSLDELEINLLVKGIMILPCAITLKEVKYEFETEINDTLDRILEENSKKLQNTIDILPIIWENILLEVPMRVVSTDAKYEKTEGEGWRLISEE